MYTRHTKRKKTPTDTKRTKQIVNKSNAYVKETQLMSTMNRHNHPKQQHQHTQQHKQQHTKKQSYTPPVCQVLRNVLSFRCYVLLLCV